MTTPTYGIPDTIGERQHTVLQISSLSSGASAASAVDLAAGYRIFKIDTNVPARVRLYTDEAHRDADALRDIGTDPSGDHGVMLEVVTTTELLSLTLSPLVDGATAAGPTSVDGATVPVAITNLDTGSAAVSALFAWIRTE